MMKEKHEAFRHHFASPALTGVSSHFLDVIQSPAENGCMPDIRGNGAFRNQEKVIVNG